MPLTFSAHLTSLEADDSALQVAGERAVRWASGRLAHQQRTSHNALVQALAEQHLGIVVAGPLTHDQQLAALADADVFLEDLPASVTRGASLIRWSSASARPCRWRAETVLHAPEALNDLIGKLPRSRS